MRILRKLSIYCLLLCGAGSASMSQTLPPSFSELLKSGSMKFALPPNFAPTPVLVNGDVAYDFAVRSKTQKLEIRYRIVPFNRTTEKPGPGANIIYQGLTITMGLNISGGKHPPYQAYPDNSVREEFGADAGGTSFVECDSDFGKGYGKCLISVIHRDNVADAYAFFLFDDLRVLQTALMTDNVYHALRFQ